jgi:hypothetical protein
MACSVYHCIICLDGGRRAMEVLGQGSWCADQELNRAPPEYESVDLPLHRKVSYVDIYDNFETNLEGLRCE